MKIKDSIIRMLLAIVLFISPLCSDIAQAEVTEETAVKWLQQENILNGDFGVKDIAKLSDTKITRQEFIALLVNALGVDEKEYANEKLIFADKKEINPKLENYMKAANSLGIIKSVTKKQKVYMKPSKKLTRQMAAYYLGKATGIDMDLPLEGYTDRDQIAADVMRFVTGLVQADVMKGKTVRRFSPTVSMTWGEAAALIQAAAEKGCFTQRKIKMISEYQDLLGPVGLAVDEEEDILYIASALDNQIKQYKDAKITVVAGKQTVIGFDGADIGGYKDDITSEALFHQPLQLCCVVEGVLVADSSNACIRFIETKTGTVYSFAGMKGNEEIDEVTLLEPQGIVVGSEGVAYIADTGNNCIFQLDEQGKLSLYAGSIKQSGYKDGKCNEALFNGPTGLCYSNQTLYVVDTGNQRIRAIKDGKVTTIAGSAIEYKEKSDEFIGGFKDGVADEALFDSPMGITVAEDGTLYVADTGNGRIRVIKNGYVTTLFGGGHPVNVGDDYSLVSPRGIAWYQDRLYITDYFQNCLFCINLE